MAFFVTVGLSSVFGFITSMKGSALHHALEIANI